MALRGLWTALAACLLLLLPTAIALASTSPVICVVRVGRAVDDGVLERIRGQTSDLPLTLVRAQGRIEPERGAARREASALARAHGARAVVWFEVAERGDITIFVLDPRDARLFVHHVDPESGSVSAMQEAASLIVRDVLSSLIEGVPIGEPLETPAPDANGDQPPSREPPEDAPQGRERRPPAAPVAVPASTQAERWMPFTAVGGRVVLSHARPSVALSHRLGVSRGAMEGGAVLTLGATDVWTDPIASLLVRRHVAGGFVGWRWALADEIMLAVDVHAGAAVFLRSTRPRVAYLRASESRANVNAFVGPEARVSWGTWPRVSVGAGVDFVVAPPAFSYEGTTGGRQARELALWPLQPYLSVSIDFDRSRAHRR